MRQFIGLCGPEGAGKSTAAKILREEHGAEVLPFAAPLKKMILALGVPERHIYGDITDKSVPLEIFGGQTARFALQTLGTEWGRNFFGADFWCRAWLQAVQSIEAPMVVSDDVRFASEVDAIRACGGKVICVVRSDDDFLRVPKHASEDFLALREHFDAVVYNDGSIERLKNALHSALLAVEVIRQLEHA